MAEKVRKYLTYEKIPHAFLFTGSKGTGKTSTARIMAKGLNCTSTTQPGIACGTCDICVRIGKSEHLDVLEIDAASNRGIDEIREIREKIKLAPLELKYKVYIIDEVHMLTNEAFNALLKTLEEPPEHAVFILATTEVHKVPETIISRCVQIDFHKASVADTIKSLTRIVKSEKLEIEEEALTEIARTSDGSFRDAAKLLEELVVHHPKITTADVERHTGRAESSLKNEFLRHLKAKKIKELMALMKKLGSQGINWKVFFTDILQTLEEELMREVMTKDSGWKKYELIKILSLLTKAFTQSKVSVIEVLPFEIALVEYTNDETSESSPAEPIKTEENREKNQFNDQSVSEITDKWGALLEHLKPFNHSLAGILRSCRPIRMDNGILYIEAAYKFHAERLSDTKAHDLLVKGLKSLVGLDLKVAVLTKERS